MFIYALSDLHLCFSNTDKTMEFFGNTWKDYTQKIKNNWKKKIKDDDLVLIPGDISWAIKLKDALIDLEWIHNLPGRKIILKGNHDYWWTSLKKLNEVIPPSIQIIQNNAITIDGISIAGSRLWDTQEFNFNKYINYIPNPNKNEKEEQIQIDLSEKIFEREYKRLKLSLDKMDKNAKLKIVMTHYPPISADLQDSKVSKLLEKHKIDICVFGHLHSVKKRKKLFGEKNNIKYIFASSDFLDFDPIKII